MQKLKDLAESVHEKNIDEKICQVSPFKVDTE